MNIEIHNKFAIIFLSIIILVGIFGNLLNLKVFNQAKMRSTSTFRLLFYLSFINIFVLLICSTDTFLTYGFNIEIRQVSTFLCKVHTFLTYYLTHLSSVILMIVNLERVFMVCKSSLMAVFIKKFSKSIRNVSGMNNSKVSESTKSRFGITITFILVLLAIINLHFLLFLSLNQIKIGMIQENQTDASLIKNDFSIVNILVDLNKTINATNDLQLLSKKSIDEFAAKIRQNRSNIENLILVCSPISYIDYNYFLDNVWVYIDVSVYSLVPFIVMSLCSLFILYEINKTTKEFSRNSEKCRQNRNLLVKRKRRNKQMLIMLIASNLYFIVCSLPFYLTYFFYRRGQEETDSYLEKSDEDLSQPILIVVHALAYSNNAFNFIFYGLFSQKYRQELGILICGYAANQHTQTPTQLPTKNLSNNALRRKSSIRVKLEHSRKSQMPRLHDMCPNENNNMSNFVSKSSSEINKLSDNQMEAFEQPQLTTNQNISKTTSSANHVSFEITKIN